MSMGALFTGRTPSIETGEGRQNLPLNSQSWCGLARLAEPGDSSCVPLAVETLAGRLASAGYATLGVTSNVLLYEP